MNHEGLLKPPLLGGSLWRGTIWFPWYLYMSLVRHFVHERLTVSTSLQWNRQPPWSHQTASTQSWNHQQDIIYRTYPNITASIVVWNILSYQNSSHVAQVESIISRHTPPVNHPGPRVAPWLALLWNRPRVVSSDSPNLGLSAIPSRSVRIQDTPQNPRILPW